MQDNKLDFAVIGAQKCATSWMFYCLTEHPELVLPDKKQEVSYIGGEAFRGNGGADWFFDRYSVSVSARLRGDVSVDYLYDRSASLHTLAKFLAYIFYHITTRMPLIQHIRTAIIPIAPDKPWFVLIS